VSKPDYVALATEIGTLVEAKNAAYGSSFAKCGDFLRILYPDGIAPAQYQDALLIVRIFDKLMRIATAKDALGENPYRDIAGYGLLGAVPSESAISSVVVNLASGVQKLAIHWAHLADEGKHEEAGAALVGMKDLLQELCDEAHLGVLNV
jgi:hypothetical protein